MNYSIIRYIVGLTLILEGALMAPSCVVAVIYRETAFWALLGSALACVAFGVLLRRRAGQRRVFRPRRLRDGGVVLAGDQCHGRGAIRALRCDSESDSCVF